MTKKPTVFKDRSGKEHVLRGNADAAPREQVSFAKKSGSAKPSAPAEQHTRDEWKKIRQDRGTGKKTKSSAPAAAVPQSGNRFEKKKNKSRNFYEKPERPASFDKRERPNKSEGGRGRSGGGRKDHFEKPRHFEDRDAYRPRKPASFNRPDEEVAGTYLATVQKTKGGSAFLILDSKAFDDLFIPPSHAKTLFQGDRVEVKTNPDDEIVGLKLVERRMKELVGKFVFHKPFGREDHYAKKADQGYLLYENRKTKLEVFLPQVPTEVKGGDWIKVKLSFEEDDRVIGTVVAHYGLEVPANEDIALICGEFNLVEEHDPKAIEEAKSYRIDVPGKDLEDREDLREMPFITIDGETARDFDDAIYVEREGKNYWLWVAIADVSHYVKEGTKLDDEAYARATSVYFPERAFHMLPGALSENLCSLRPNEPRLSMVSKILISPTGEKLKTEIYNAVIQSKRRATYTEIEKERIENEGNQKWEFRPHFELYEILRRARTERGSIDFEIPEAKILVDETGEPTEVARYPRNDAHRLIENFMIAANEAVTEWALARKWPFIYRVHEQPERQSLDKFQKLAITVGADIKIGKEIPRPKVLAEWVKKLEAHPASILLNTTLLRSMKQAVYTSVHGEHYGLASTAYTHFTSPIRRYPDLIVHRMLKYALAVEAKKQPRLKDQALQKLEEKLEQSAVHSSYRERIASEAEREIIRIKAVRLMKRHLGDEFEGAIIGMNEKALYVQLDDPFVEGAIPKDALTADRFEFNEDRMQYYGRRTKITHKIGDRVRVQVVKSNFELRQIEFALEGEETIE